MPGKIYGSAQDYEQKLRRVMDRLGIKQFDWNHDRFEAWIEFTYKGDHYHFSHSVAKAQQVKSGPKLQYGSDCFAQLVLALEDLARLVARGIYDLSTWTAGLKALPAPVDIPPFLRFLEFDRLPQTVGEIEDHFRALAKRLHPDAGGSAEAFRDLQSAREQALQYIGDLRRS
ncbi:MAG: J domain-containing protein [Symbiobacteriia bacterium]